MIFVLFWRVAASRLRRILRLISPRRISGGYSVNTPAVCDFTATLTEDGAELLLCVRAHIDAECARCLEPLTRDYDFTREYFVRDRDLEDPDFELPCNENGCLDLEELAYQELIFEVPAVLLCSADCQGLCPHLWQEEGGRVFLPTGRQCCPCRCKA